VRARIGAAAAVTFFVLYQAAIMEMSDVVYET
jgi:hypothetical protein